MTWAPGPVVTRRRLGGELKRLRLGSGLLLEEVARKLECSPSKISRLENGKGIPRWRDVRDLLDAYAVPEGEHREQLLDWSRTGRAQMWWQAYADVLPNGLDTYVELEWDAARIRAYEPQIVHGLLQTDDYARGVLRAAFSATRSEAEIERMVDVRRERRKALDPEHGLAFCCVLDESTLHRVVGSPSVLRDQLAWLLMISERPHVEIRIFPFSAGFVTAALSSFGTLDFSEGVPGGLLYRERPDDNEVSSDASEVASHRLRLEEILRDTLDATGTRERLAERIASLDR